MRIQTIDLNEFLQNRKNETTKDILWPILRNGKPLLIQRKMRSFHPITIGKLKFSIQCGYGLHSIPDAYRKDILDYSAFEVMITNEKGVPLSAVDLEGLFPSVKFLSLGRWWDGLNIREGCLYNYLPKKILQSLLSIVLAATEKETDKC